MHQKQQKNSSASQHHKSLSKTLEILDEMSHHTIELRKSIVEILTLSVNNPLSKRLKEKTLDKDILK